MTRRWLYALPLIACSAVLYWLSSIPGLSPPDLGVSWDDKVYHAIAFLGYGWCTIVALLGWRSQVSWRVVFMTVMLWGTVFAMSDELHQSFVPNRSAGWDDVIADIVGLLLSTASTTLLRGLLLRYRFLR